ncbi:hypothetical protein BOX15_Mlig001108g1 [Macrostomum lignano]|uniref:EF-hand domain-containing protein n=1 Tax=Macrostomum lignano TaxID=282301 RepID=A0A267DP46_9PLAT|nr:hypothetical protein BOX15_Mlig001108g1 [Macrostomum lignano]
MTERAPYGSPNRPQSTGSRNSSIRISKTGASRPGVSSGRLQQPQAQQPTDPMDNRQRRLPDSPMMSGRAASPTAAKSGRVYHDPNHVKRLIRGQLAAAGAQSGRTEEEYLRSIWQELGVGRSGFLTLPELARVCEYIGMDDLTDSHLYQLFENLDEDGDGHVSFNEFVRGLFRHTPNPSVSGPAAGTAAGVGGSPRPPSRGGGGVGGGPTGNQIRRSRSSGTPGNTGTLFSSIDKDGTGYARGADICRFLTAHGLLNGEEILKFLQFDANSRVNLAELTYALDTELAGVTDGVTQAGILAYQAELRHSRAALESVTAERNKLRMDLVEERQRVSSIIREGDEGQRETERHQAKQMANVEKRYQEQIRSLQAQMDYERDRFQTEFLKQRKSMEHVILSLKDEETRLKDRIASLQREMARCESEQMDLVERLAESEKLNVRQQRELDAVAELHRKLNSMAEQLKDSVPIKEHVELQAEADELRGEVKKLRDWVDELTGRLRPRKRLRRSRGDTLDDSVDAPNEGEASTVHQDEAASCGGGGGRKSATMLEEHRDITVATRRSKPVRKLTAETETEEEAEWLVVNKVQASAFNDVVEALKHNFEDKLIKLEKKHNQDLVLRLQAAKLLYDKKAEEMRLKNLALQETNERKDATIGILRLDVESLKQARDELEEKLRLLNEQLDQIDTTMLDDLSETIRNRVNSLVRARLAQLHALDRAKLLREFSQHKERLLLLAAENENRPTADVGTQTGEDSHLQPRDPQLLQQATHALSRIPKLRWLAKLPQDESKLLVETVCDRLQALKKQRPSVRSKPINDTERKQILEATELLSSLPELHWLQEMPEAQRVTLTANVCDNLQQLKNSGDLRSTDFGEASTTDEQQTVLEATQLFSRIPELQWIQEVPPAERTRLAAAVCDSLQSFRTAASDISAEDREKLQEAARVLRYVPELQWLSTLSQSEQVELAAALGNKMQQLIKDPQPRAKYSAAAAAREAEESELLQQALQTIGESSQLQWLNDLSQFDKQLLAEAMCDSLQQLRVSQQLAAAHPEVVLEATQLLSTVPELQWIQEVPQADRARLAAALCDSLQSFRTAAFETWAEDREKLQKATRVLSDVPELQWLRSLSQSEQVELTTALSNKMQQLIKDPQLRAKYSAAAAARGAEESELLQQALQIIGESSQMQWLNDLRQFDKQLLAEAMCDLLQQLRASQQLAAAHPEVVLEATQLLSRVPELQWIQEVPQAERARLAAAVCDSLQSYGSGSGLSPHFETFIEATEQLSKVPELRWIQEVPQADRARLAAAVCDSVKKFQTGDATHQGLELAPTDMQVVFEATQLLSSVPKLHWIQELPPDERSGLAAAVYGSLQSMKTSVKFGTGEDDDATLSTRDSRAVVEATELLSRVPELRWIQELPETDGRALVAAAITQLQRSTAKQSSPEQKFSPTPAEAESLQATSRPNTRLVVNARSFYIDPCWKYRTVGPRIAMASSTGRPADSATTAAAAAHSSTEDETDELQFSGQSKAEEKSLEVVQNRDEVDQATAVKFSYNSPSTEAEFTVPQQTDPPKDERVEMQNLKIQLEKEIDELRRSKTLDDNYRSKVDELNSTNERLQMQNQQAEEAMEQMAQNEAAVNAAEKAENEFLNIEKRHNELLQAANERFAKENKKLEEELEETRKRLNEAEAELEFKTNECSSLKENHDKLTDAVSKGQQNLEKEMVYCDIKQKEIDEFKKNVGKLTAERDKNKELLERVRTDLEDKTNELDEVQKKLDQLKTDKDQLEKNHKDLELKLEAEHKEKESLTEANNTMTSALDQSNKSLEEKDAELERKDEQLNEAKEEASKYKQENEELERKAITAEKEVEKKDDELKSLQTTVADLERDKEDLTKQVQELDESLKNKDQEMNTYKSNNEKLSASVEQQGKSLEKKSAEVEAKQREIESLKAEKTKLNQDRREEEARLQEKVKEQYKETLDAKRERDDLNRTKASLEKQIEKQKQKIESLQKDIGQLKENTENLTSSLETAEKTQEDTNNHCKELEEELNKLKDEKNRLENEREELSRKLADTEADKDRLQQESEQLKKSTEAAEKDKEALQREFDDYRKEAEAASDELKKSNESVTKSLDKAMKNLETRNQEFQAKAREAQSSREAKEALALEKDRLDHSLRKANTELEKRTQDLARAKSDKERIEAAQYESERRAKDAEHRLAERTRDLADQRSKCEQLQAEKAELEAGAREQRARTQELQNEVSSLKRDRDRLQRELEDTRRSADGLETKKMDIEKELDSEKKNSGKLRRDAESLQDRIRELEARLYGKDREIADAKAAQEEAQRERKKLQRDLDDQQKSAESLKNTNERLEEELQEVSNKLDREIGKSDGSGGDLTDQLKFENSRLTKQKLELSREVAELKDKLKAAEIKVEREKEENDDLLMETKNLNAKIKEVQNMLNAQERENKELKRFNDNLEGAIRSSEAEDRSKAERLERDCEQRVKSAKAQVAQKEAELAQLKEDAEGQYSARKAAEEFANRLDRNLRKKELEAEKLLDEKRSLEAQVEELNNQLRTDRTDRNRYNELIQKLNEAQKKADTLEKALNMKNSETSKMLMNTQEGFQRQVQNERREREEMQQKMERQQQLLSEQTEKMKKQLERTAKTDQLLKELYAENAQLMKALQVTEQRQKVAEQRCQQLDDKCRSLQKVLGRVSQGAAH